MRERNPRRVLGLVTVPTVVLLLVFVLPMIAMLLFGFREGTFGEARDTFTLQNFREFLGDTDVHRLLWRSTVTAAMVTGVAVVLAYPVAYYLAFRAGAKRMTLMILMILPAMTSYLLRVLAWKVILSPEGPVLAALTWFGIDKESLPSLLYNRTAVIVTLVYVWIPFASLPIFASLSRIDTSLHEASADLGGGRIQTFLRVTLPLSLPGVAAAVFFVFIPTLGEWVTPMIIGGVRGVLYGNIIQDEFVRGLNWPAGSVMSIAMIVLMAIIVTIPLIVWRIMRRRREAA